MGSKEEILHEEFRQLDTIYFPSKQRQCVYRAMDKHASIKAVEFAEWLLCNYNTSEASMSLCWRSALKEDYRSQYTTQELFTLYKEGGEK